MINAVAPAQALALQAAKYKKGNVVKITAIYDNRGHTFDRYTIITDQTYGGPAGEDFSESLNLSEHPDDPMGFSNWSGCIPGYHLGRPIRFEALSAELQNHIVKRVFGE